MRMRKTAIALIVAMNQNRMIGVNNTLPWSLPNDLKYFKAQTLDHAIIMGRKTFDSIGRALPKRHNIVITRNKCWKKPNTYTVDSLKSAIKLADTLCNKECHFVIGGESIYELALPLANKLHITLVDNKLAGDKYFPQDITQLCQQGWTVQSQVHHQKDPQHAYDFCIYTLTR